MAHEITTTDNLFSVREMPWHRMGAILPEHPTRAEAQQLAHPWEPIGAPIFTGEPTVDPVHGPGVEYLKVDSHKAIQRSDNGAMLGVVGTGYTPVSNSEMWDIAEAIQGDHGDVRFETAGSLAGGARVWILIRLEEPLRVPGDPNGATIPYYALQNSHDGSGAFRGQATMTRIVCANTSKVADLDARQRGTEFSFRHSKNVAQRIDQARAALTGWRESIPVWEALQRHLLTIEMTDDEVIAYLDRWLPEPDPQIATERVRRNAAAARGEWFGALRSATCEGVANTAYGVLQASIEYAEHMRAARTEESRFSRSYLGQQDVVAHAAKLLTV